MVTAVPLPNPAISYGAGNTLSVPGIYATYQWHLNGAAIPGATGATFHPATNGNYTVKVTTAVANCPGTSAVHLLRNLDAGTVAIASDLSIYPNPSDGHLSVTLNGLQTTGPVTVTVRTVTGQEIFRKLYHPTGSQFSEQLDVSHAAKGIYFVIVQANGGQMAGKVNIE
jgi:hypothetical protein